MGWETEIFEDEIIELKLKIEERDEKNKELENYNLKIDQVKFEEEEKELLEQLAVAVRNLDADEAAEIVERLKGTDK